MVNECGGIPTTRERHLCCRKQFLETNSLAQSWQGMVQISFRSTAAGAARCQCNRWEHQPGTQPGYKQAVETFIWRHAGACSILLQANKGRNSTLHTPRLLQSRCNVKYHVRFSQKIEKLNFFTCVPGSESFDPTPTAPGVQLVQHHHLETPRRFRRTRPLNWHEHHTETARADFGPSQNLYGLTKVIFQHDNILWHHFSTSQRPSVYRSFTWEVWCRTWSRKSFPMLLDRQWVVISTSWKQVP